MEARNGARRVTQRQLEAPEKVSERTSGPIAPNPLPPAEVPAPRPSDIPRTVPTSPCASDRPAGCANGPASKRSTRLAADGRRRSRRIADSVGPSLSTAG